MYESAIWGDLGLTAGCFYYVIFKEGVNFISLLLEGTVSLKRLYTHLEKMAGPLICLFYEWQ